MAMRRRIYSETAKPPTFAQIPDELLTQILAVVASSSYTDYFNAKIWHMWMHNLEYIAWDKQSEEKNFYNTCKSSGNPVVLYKEGVVEYFTTECLLILEDGKQLLASSLVLLREVQIHTDPLNPY